MGCARLAAEVGVVEPPGAVGEGGLLSCARVVHSARQGVGQPARYSDHGPTAQGLAEHMGLRCVPLTVTHCAPDPTEMDLHLPLAGVTAPSQAPGLVLCRGEVGRGGRVRSGSFGLKPPPDQTHECKHPTANRSPDPVHFPSYVCIPLSSASSAPAGTACLLLKVWSADLQHQLSMESC